MASYPWTPWHQVIALRPDLKSGELSMAAFAADLYDVVMQRGVRLIYEDPAEFFALTYPTYNLRELARDVVLRLAGQNDKAVRQLALTYGGGKTHTLITLYHLANDPASLPYDLPAVKEFQSKIGITLPKARIAALTFDKLDVEKGMEVRSPSGEVRWLKQPWSVLAYQLAGSEGLRLLHAENLDAERESAPAENLLSELLALPQKEGLATLILLDEVLMYAREKVGLSPAWQDRLVNFFQYLTQAVVRVDRACLVASLLATDPRKNDPLGKQITQEFESVFMRQREESIQPVVKEDVAEVLRRRLFTPESIRDRNAFRPHVVAALKGIEAIDPQTKQEGTAAEERFVSSYPFHPDLTEVFYSKWTGLEGFQRTRGVLRTFALALREAEKWDTAPLISVNVFLGQPRNSTIAEATRELAQIATAEEYEGRTQQWSMILQSELDKALEIQRDFSALAGREVEQAVLAAFLHSQPIGQRLQTRDLFLLVGHTRPDKIELEKALQRWATRSWFLDDLLIQEVEKNPDGSTSLPKAWRLGSRPNLTQMHDDACQHIPNELIEARLIEDIGKHKNLTTGAAGQGVKVHNLPEWPRQVEADGDFHFVILGPKAACIANSPSVEAKRFIDETTAADRPRVFRNGIVLAVPSLDGLDAARNAIMKYLGWEEVRNQLKDQQVDPTRESMLLSSLEASRKAIPESIRQAYCMVVTVDTNDKIQAYRITPSGEPMFNTIKQDPRIRIQETSVSADALLPEGPYNLWKEGDTFRRLKDLVTAFAQYPHLPKMLNRQAILDTLIAGCKQGLFVLRQPRADRTFRTFWHEQPDEEALKEPALEVVLPEAATLSQVQPALLAHNNLPGLWSGDQICVQDVYAYFCGQTVIQIQKDGYEEPLLIPKAGQSTVDAAIQDAVKGGFLWLIYGPASLYGEDIPACLIAPDATLNPPPPRISPLDLLPDRLPGAWKDKMATALSIAAALSSKYNKPLPWRVISNALDGAFKVHYLERTSESKNWPCDYGGAQGIIVRVPDITPPPPPPPPLTDDYVAEAALQPDQIQDLADVMSKILATAAGNDMKFRIGLNLDGKVKEEVVQKLNDILGEVSDQLHLNR